MPAFDNRRLLRVDRGTTVSGPLQGIRVLDLSRILAGPWAAQLLADFGADVIKVERPGSGDDTRHWGPPWIYDDDGSARDAAYFLAANRNKRSITVDLAHPQGQQIIRDLARRADILIENFKVGSLAKFGLDATTLCAAHPALIYCSLSAYGQTGSKAADPGYDAMIQASAGLMSITGAPEEEGGEPQKVGVAVSDIMAGMYATAAILAALEARHRTGLGQHIDVPLYDSQVAWLANQAMNYLVGGEVPRRLGTAHPNIVPYQSFATSDGHLMLAVGNDRQFRACVECLGVPELADTPEYSTNEARVRHRRELVALLAARFKSDTTALWTERLRRCRVPAGPINDLDRVLSGAHAEERALVRHLPHATAGALPTIANPVSFSATPVRYELAPPTLGQHTQSILREELGYSEDEIRALGRAGAL
jgi:crotonobetainyl-CoA:carnitine CoA-transferase CaiB-like acyl-CoA transferase